MFRSRFWEERMGSMVSNSYRPAKAVVSLVLIAVAAFLILNFFYKWVDLSFFGGRRNPAEPLDRQVLAIDSVTLDVYEVEKKADDKWPLENPDTGERTLWAAWICSEEKILFPGEPGKNIQSCPFCESVNVGGATADQKDLPVKMPVEEETDPAEGAGQ